MSQATAADEPVQLNKQPKSISGKIADVDAVVLNGPVKTPGTALFPVPIESEFGNAEYLEAPALRQTAAKLIGEHFNLAGLELLTTDNGIRFFWRKHGTKTAIGKCIKPSGLLFELSEAAFIIWLAADKCAGWTKHKVEALLYHELCHAGRDEQGRTFLRQHDVQAFASEVRYYGLWAEDLREFGKAVRQLTLDDAE